MTLESKLFIFIVSKENSESHIIGYFRNFVNSFDIVIDMPFRKLFK